MRLYTLINIFISKCFQSKTTENKYTQTEACLPTQTKDRNTKIGKKKSRASEKSTQTIEEPLLERIYEQPTAPEALHAPTVLLPIRIEKRKDNEMVQKFFYRIWQKHGVHMRTPRREIDGHGHMFYCFSCRQPHTPFAPYKNHKSFDSKEALESHCEAKHNLKITI